MRVWCVYAAQVAYCTLDSPLAPDVALVVIAVHEEETDDADSTLPARARTCAHMRRTIVRMH